MDKKAAVNFATYAEVINYQNLAIGGSVRINILSQYVTNKSAACQNDYRRLKILKVAAETWLANFQAVVAMNETNIPLCDLGFIIQSALVIEPPVSAMVWRNYE